MGNSPKPQKMIRPFRLAEMILAKMGEGEIVFRFTRLPGRVYGYSLCDEIMIDHTRGDIFDTFVHEMLHHLKPHWNHVQVRAQTKYFISRSSWDTKQRILCALGNLEARTNSLGSLESYAREMNKGTKRTE